MNSNKKQHVWQLATAFLLVGLIILSVNLRETRTKLEQSNSDIRQISLFLNGEIAVEGFACGVLSEEIAHLYIGTNLRKNYSQIPKNLSGQASWQDSCRYTDISNSNKYIELFINHFQTQEHAKDSL